MGESLIDLPTDRQMPNVITHYDVELSVKARDEVADECQVVVGFNASNEGSSVNFSASNEGSSVDSKSEQASDESDQVEPVKVETVSNQADHRMNLKIMNVDKRLGKVIAITGSNVYRRRVTEFKGKGLQYDWMFPVLFWRKKRRKKEKDSNANRELANFRSEQVAAGVWGNR